LTQISFLIFPEPERSLDSSVRGITGVTIMASNARAFFVGVGTTFVILAIGFGGGLLLAKNAMEPAPSITARSTAGSLPTPARIILPASAESAQPPQPSAAGLEPAPQAIPTTEIQQPIELNESAKRAEQRKGEYQQRGRRKRVAERRAKREATRLAMQQQEQQHQRPGIMASGGDKDPQGFGGGFFGN
jgi:type IV secretory pathway VirB10-like protein